MSAHRGVLAVVLLLAVLGASVLLAALSLRQPGSSRAASTVLVLELPAELDEAPPPLRGFSLWALRRPRPTLYSVVDGLRRAADDDRVEALVLHIDGVEWGWAKIAEVRDAILEFRRSGKPVLASLAGGGEAEYLLASAANRVCVPPTATLRLDGLTESALFLRGTFDKIGVTPNYAHAGQYKSGVEGYTRTAMSPPAREALQALLDDEFRLLVDSLAAARRLTPDSVERLLDEGPFLAAEAVARGLVDTLLYDADVDSLALQQGRRRLSSLSFYRYLDRLSPPRTGPHVAMIVAAGTIGPGRSRQSPTQGAILGSETLIEALRQARTRRAVRAVVLRIDSPGGVGPAADDIWREVRRTRAEKPVIVSMSDVAASGGYFIAVAADSIVAQPGTFTGSIGVYGGKLNILGLYHKLGLNVETLSRGRHAGMLSPYRDFTPDEARRFQAEVENFYRVFVSRVAEGRKRPPGAIDSVGQGRVWSGIAARERGLVDALGGFQRAFAMARSRAGIAPGTELVVERYPRVERSFLQRMLSDLVSEEDDESLADLALPPALAAWVTASRFPAGVALALMPYTVWIR